MKAISYTWKIMSYITAYQQGCDNALSNILITITNDYFGNQVIYCD